MNIYDLITFPGKAAREEIRANYSVFSCYKQIPTNLIEKYSDLPAGLWDYETTNTWINEYNHLWFFMLIPLYQAIDSYQKILGNNNPNEHYHLFYYYSEIVAYYTDAAFEKSAFIFNEMFELGVNEGLNSLGTIYKKLLAGVKGNPLIQEVVDMLIEIRKNAYYKNVTLIRNKNTHSIKIHHRNLYNQHNDKDRTTTTCISKVIKPEEVLDILFGSIELLSHYTDFITNIIDRFYASICSETG